MKFQHRFQVNAPLDQVVEFHSRSASMAAITPPPIIVKVHHAPPVLADGDEMDFTMWLGPLPLRWLARIEATPQEGFIDRQIKGPFAEWVHHHKFVRVDDQTTVILDEINLRLRCHLFWGVIGLGMGLGLPLLFAYRQWKTRRILE